MGGGGGGRYIGPFSENDPSTLHDKVRAAEATAADLKFSTDLEAYLGDRLGVFNQRDDSKIGERLDAVKNALGDELSSSFDLKFGGSVAKHTYVDGLSDVDSLLVLKGQDVGDSPSVVRDAVADRLLNEFSDAEVSTGQIAVTVAFADGMELQFIPAVQDGNKLRVPSWSGDDWSSIDSEKFQNKLSTVNAECNSKLVPTIKLAKAINANLPQAHQLSGYHIEALGVDAFKIYEGARTLNKMLPHLIGHIAKGVLKPVVDSTGQSVHVDGYLGGNKSKTRLEVAHVFERLNKRVANAVASGSFSQWDSLFGDE